MAVAPELIREIETNARAVRNLDRHIPHETGERRAKMEFHRDWHARILANYLGTISA